jgi:hypothetical protein
MPDYFVFWDEIVGRIRIHRADCEVCKYGKGMHEGRIIEGRASTSDWEPADTYAKACEIVAGLKHRKPALKKSAQTDCGLCHPERHN